MAWCERVYFCGPCLPDSHPDHEGPKTSDPPQLCQSHPGREVLPQTACPMLQHELQAACVTKGLRKATGSNILLPDQFQTGMRWPVEGAQVQVNADG